MNAETALLRKVLDYYEGRKPYDFHRLSDDQRGNEAFDAWQLIAEEIQDCLTREQTETTNGN